MTLTSEFRRYQVGQTISAFGSACTAFILPLIAFDQHNSVTALGVATVFTYLPYPLFGLHIGVLADRLDRRKLLIGADLGRAAVIAAVPLLQAVGALHLPVLLAVIFAHGTLRLLFEAAQFAVVPALVPDKEQFARANGQSQAAYSSAAALGPVVAGLLLAVVVPATVLWVDVASFGVSAAAVMTMRTNLSAPPRPRRRYGAEIREGLGLVFGNAVLRNLTFAAIVVNLAAGPYWAQSIYLAKTNMNASDTGVGLMFAASGLGVVAAGLLAGRLSERFSLPALLSGGVFVLGGAIAVFAYTSSVTLAIVMAGLTRAGAVMFGVNANSLRQRLVPTAALGRVITVALIFAWTAQPLGAAIGTVLIKLTGDAPAVVGIGGVIVLAFAVQQWMTRSSRTVSEGSTRAEFERRLGAE